MAYFSDNKNAFAITDVMDLKLYPFEKTQDKIQKAASAKAAIEDIEKDLQTNAIDVQYLQSLTLTVSGPTLTISGGKGNNNLLKAGKTCRCEMTDALGEPQALSAIGGIKLTKNGELVVDNSFPGAYTIIGDTYVVDKTTGQHVDSKVIIYQFLPDAIPSLAWDGSTAATFAMNGDVLATDVATTDTSSTGKCKLLTQSFFAIVPQCEIDKPAAAESDSSHS